MRISKPRVVSDRPIAAAYELAAVSGEPILLPLQYYADDRGWSLMNQLQGVLDPQGQINYSCQYPGVIKAWHAHEHQTDFWTCLHGHFKVGVYCEQSDRCWMAVIGEKQPGTMIIPPLLWHGLATVGHTPAGLLYYVTHQYNPADPDERRRPHDSVAGVSWAVAHH